MPKKSQLTFFTQLFNHLLTGIIIIDSQFQVVFSNATIEQTLSTSTSQISTSDIFQILTDNHIAPDEQAHYQFQLRQQFEHTAKIYQAFIRHDCTILGINVPILVDYSVSPMEYLGKIYFIIEIWTKDRQSRIHQEQQQQAQHQITRQLIRSMAHEVKNPLAGIYGASQLLQKHISSLITQDTPKNAPKAVKVQNYLTIIMDETQRLNNLVNQLLGSPKLPQWQQVNIHEPLAYVLTLVTAQPQAQDIHFIKDYDLSLPEIMADKDQLIQVFLNLINNAVQALTENQIENPTITLQTRVAYQHTIGEIRHKSLLKIDIIDNGVGIDPEFLPQIFYPLVTGRANGTGLGLALVHDILQRHHGMIDVQSAPHHTVFSVYLPFQSPT